MPKPRQSPPWRLIAIGRVIGAFMAALGASVRWTRLGASAGAPLWAERKPVILVVWHGRLLLAHCTWPLGRRGIPIHALVSNSREGDIITQAFSVVGVDAIRGSTAKAGQQKGGMEAMMAMIRTLRAGQCVCITPDGPRGPRQRVQRGVISLAKATGAPILCVTWNTAGRRVLKSWDNMVAPMPFSRGVMMWAEPITIARDASPEEEERVRVFVETELNRITSAADRHFGAAPTMPDEGARD
jgi:lysophospholipid acyltransferase (LPLAT)-like uncharacterized protein